MAGIGRANVADSPVVFSVVVVVLAASAKMVVFDVPSIIKPIEGVADNESVPANGTFADCRLNIAENWVLSPS